ncbi:chorismate-binding protein [Cryomorphaceae bacterium 1068]|nr:chorismate-binding protein [Cryomorphaceae bacterium 1068]
MRRIIALSSQYSHLSLYLTDSSDFTFYAGDKRTISLRQTEGAFEGLKTFQSEATCEVCGYLGYDLKNDLEKLTSENSDYLSSPEAAFFEAELRVSFKNGSLFCDAINAETGEMFLANFEAAEPIDQKQIEVFPKPRTTEAEYLSAANSLKAHLQRGDIYEANYCIQFAADSPNFNPYAGFYALWQKTKAPFSVFARLGDFFVLSGSPERYLKREGKKLFSQPIKGTAKRSIDPVLDEKSKADLPMDPKEQSENVMIVDLVRNDLSRVAKRGSVHVSELFGVYSFKTVHHLISTIQAELKDGLDSWEALKATFPMGSMTGAPKISAMKLIERYENFKRGAYSGAFGIMQPNGDFDFNVLIRTLLFENNSKKLAFGVGSAITIQADPIKEYKECLLKAEALMQSLRKTENELRGEIQS